LNEEQKRLLEQRSTDSTEAYKAFILGTYFWNTRSRDGLPKAIDYFKRAVELDANYANAYAGLADSHAMMAYYGFGVPGEAFPLARQTAEKALALDGTVAEAYLALAQVQKHFEHDDDASRRSLEKAIELSPYNATARQRYAWQLVADKKIEPAVAEMRLAHEYNPVSPAINTALCQVLSFRREYQEAAGYCKHANEIAPDSSLYQLEYADVLFFGGQVDEAIGKLENAALKNDQAYSLFVRLAYFYAKTGRRNEATKIYRELRAGSSDDSRMIIQFANVAFALGEKEESYGLLLQASEKCAIPFEADYDPLFDDLRSIDPHRQIFLRYSCDT
jgi:tetratricopeptide (TPR) repeat protein